MLRKYNMTREMVAQRIEQSDGKCVLCDRSIFLPDLGEYPKPSWAVIDHDHSSGKIRGVICSTCNSGLGGKLEMR